MTFAELIVAPKSLIRNLFNSVKRVFNFAEERTNRAVRFFHVLTAYKAGQPVDSIATQYECSKTTVLRYARIAGLSKREKKRKVSKEDVIAAYKTGRMVADIAREFDISPSRVSTIATENGINRKGKRRASN